MGKPKRKTRSATAERKKVLTKTIHKRKSKFGRKVTKRKSQAGFCETCGKYFKKVQAHSLRCSVLQVKVKCSWEGCDKSIQRCDLEKHLRLHRGTGRVLCVICGGNFQGITDLNRHIRSVHHGRRHGDTMQRCQICEGSFRRSEITTHYATQHDMKPFSIEEDSESEHSTVSSLSSWTAPFKKPPPKSVSDQDSEDGDEDDKLTHVNKVENGKTLIRTVYKGGYEKWEYVKNNKAVITSFFNQESPTVPDEWLPEENDVELSSEISLESSLLYGQSYQETVDIFQALRFPLPSRGGTPTGMLDLFMRKEFGNDNDFPYVSFMFCYGSIHTIDKRCRWYMHTYKKRRLPVITSFPTHILLPFHANDHTILFCIEFNENSTLACVFDSMRWNNQERSAEKSYVKFLQRIVKHLDANRVVPEENIKLLFTKKQDPNRDMYSMDCSMFAIHYLITMRQTLIKMKCSLWEAYDVIVDKFEKHHLENEQLDELLWKIRIKIFKVFVQNTCIAKILTGN